MQAALLMVTWFYMGQAPSTTFTHFNSIEACLVARHFILRDATQLQYDAKVEAGTQEIHQNSGSGSRISITVNAQSPAPRVSAVCAPQ